MPYRRSRKYAKKSTRRKAPYNRRAATKKRQYTRARRAVRRSYARPARSTGFKSIPFQIGNNVQRRVNYQLTWRDTISCWPEAIVGSGEGAFSTSIACSCPNQVYGLAASGNHLGTWQSIDGSAAVFGVNPMCATPFSNFTQFYVKSAKIQIFVTPTTQTLSQQLPFCGESSVFLSVSRLRSPWSSGTTVAGVADRRTILNGRNVKQGTTSLTNGGEAKGCALNGVFTPYRLFEGADIQDRSAFWGLTGGAYTENPTPPANSAFWNIMILPKAPVPTAYNTDTGTTTFTPGAPLPHRIDIKVTYDVCFFTRKDTVSATANAPIAPNA